MRDVKYSLRVNADEEEESKELRSEETFEKLVLKDESFSARKDFVTKEGDNDEDGREEADANKVSLKEDPCSDTRSWSSSLPSSCVTSKRGDVKEEVKEEP